MLLFNHGTFSSSSFSFSVLSLYDFINKLLSPLKKGSSIDVYNRLFNFNYDYPNHDLLNIISLYGYILSIEILIVLCVLFVHSSVISNDTEEFVMDATTEWVEYSVDSLLRPIAVNPYLSVHHNVSLGIGHSIESFLDFFFLVIPTSIIIYILVPSLGLLYNKEFLMDYSSYSFIIDIIGHQWYWTYQYKIFVSSLFDFLIKEDSLLAFDSIMIDAEPRLLCVDNPLYVPSYTNILLVITSADVIHSFAIPSAGVKMDALPGRVSTIGLFLLGDHVYYGQCSELCGANHGFMPIMIRSISRSLWSTYFFNSEAYATMF